MKTETIAAIATAMSNSGIGIIRISGEDAISIADKIYHSKNRNKKLFQVKSHTIHYGFIYDKEELIDEVMVAVMKAPNSYTTEDTVEINCHGGILIMNRILEIILKNGARLAEPGEFTKRAFLNGRIDLSKAEAVMDVIQSQNEYALKSSINQLNGAVFEAVKKLREEIIYEIAFIESALDDPEHISIEGYNEKLSVKIEDLTKRISKLIASSDNGKMLKEGINTVIVGKPNVGKSSLLNLLVGEEKAIVTNVAGTTRDVLEETINLHGIGLNIIDTAGIRSTEDIVEKIGVEKAKKYAADADLIVYVVDSSVDFDESDEEIIELIRDKNAIVLLNKTDLDSVITEEYLCKKLDEIEEKNNSGNENKSFSEKSDIHGSHKIIKTSTKENIGIDIFENTIKDMFFHDELKFNDEVFITNMRHKEALSDAYDSLIMVKKSLEDDMPEDFYSIDLMSAYASLGMIIGEEVGEDLVNEIFSKFCMGK
ncbi:MAG: tRNA uridine-5-carboxymethylaminomethyl(34) synthesis GTPase MnmE [Lachnospiraceae bacterium]|nr:tRNA uridine-5-carboxymethylaminomethyl(34) synthesis GTPase MnmE [Lachnospiraceae bacterium]